MSVNSADLANYFGELVHMSVARHKGTDQKDQLLFAKQDVAVILRSTVAQHVNDSAVITIAPEGIKKLDNQWRPISKYKIGTLLVDAKSKTLSGAVARLLRGFEKRTGRKPYMVLAEYEKEIEDVNPTIVV